MFVHVFEPARESDVTSALLWLARVVACWPLDVASPLVWGTKHPLWLSHQGLTFVPIVSHQRKAISFSPEEEQFLGKILESGAVNRCQGQCIRFAEWPGARCVCTLAAFFMFCFFIHWALGEIGHPIPP